jgi:NAD(P)-dependent dehydrogenase (short-subunit alcohol dehydrogenase family)
LLSAFLLYINSLTYLQGGTSGIGAIVARELAARGAQLVLLTHYPLSDRFLADYILELRTLTDNQLITAEYVDLESLHSIRQFATKWVDNAPPRRLDMIVLCANTMSPSGTPAGSTEDGLETHWGINYMANFHLLSILSPAIRAQPPDRDVRIVFGTCASYMGGELPDFGVATQMQDGGEEDPTKSKKQAKREQKAATAQASKSAARSPTKIKFTPASAYATSKLALMTFAAAFQKHLESYKRPDGFPVNARVILVDPGWTRTPGMRRHLSWGSLLGLALYLVMYPFWWIVLKSPEGGAQSFLTATMEAELGRGAGGKLIKECRQVPIMRGEVANEETQKGLWQASEKTIEELEKQGAVRRALEKKEREEAEKRADKAAASGAEPAKTPGSRRSRKTG